VVIFGYLLRLKGFMKQVCCEPLARDWRYRKLKVT